MAETAGTTETQRRVIVIVSDIHYAGDAEKARGDDFEIKAVRNPLLRILAGLYRHYYWMRHPTQRGVQLERFLGLEIKADMLIANGDYACDSAFVGVSDDATFQSPEECLRKLRKRFGDRAHFVMGDHELGKLGTFNSSGGMRLASWRRAVEQLGIQPFWQIRIENYVLIAVNSSLLALPAHKSDVLPEEWPEWSRLRETHLAEIRSAFEALPPEKRVILFCHDPTALPFLWREEAVQKRLPQVEQTIIGHLHTKLILRKSMVLAGIPPIRFLGKAVERFSTALNEAHHWRAFNVRLCPALAGIQLLNDGGYYVMELDPAAKQPARFTFHPLPRSK